MNFLTKETKNNTIRFTTHGTRQHADLTNCCNVGLITQTCTKYIPLIVVEAECAGDNILVGEAIVSMGNQRSYHTRTCMSEVVWTFLVRSDEHTVYKSFPETETDPVLSVFDHFDATFC